MGGRALRNVIEQAAVRFGIQVNVNFHGKKYIGKEPDLRLECRSAGQRDFYADAISRS